MIKINHTQINQNNRMEKEYLPHILITNDDGIFAPGIAALVSELSKIAQISVIAPDRNWSATGHSRTLDRPLRTRPVELFGKLPAWSCDGAPSDCVALGINGFFIQPVDMVVSGINSGENIGNDLTYSGTVSAAMEAVIGNVPAIAVSLESGTNNKDLAQYEPAAIIAQMVVEKTLAHRLPPNLLLNVNIPCLSLDQIKGMKVTRQGTRVYHDRVDTRTDPRGNVYHWVFGETPTAIPELGSDVGALSAGYVSITPVQLDMTAYRFMSELQSWSWETQLPALQLNPLLLSKNSLV